MNAREFAALSVEAQIAECRKALAEQEAMEKAATKGPWGVCSDEEGAELGLWTPGGSWVATAENKPQGDNLRLCAAARNANPARLAVAKELLDKWCWGELVQPQDALNDLRLAAQLLGLREGA